MLECSLVLAEKTPFGFHDRKHEIGKVLRLMKSIEPNLTKQFPEIEILGKTSANVLRILVDSNDPQFLHDGSLALMRIWKEVSPEARKKPEVKDIPRQIVLASARAWSQRPSPLTAHDIIFTSDAWAPLEAADKAAFIETLRPVLGERLSSSEGNGLRSAFSADIMQGARLRPGDASLQEAYKSLSPATTEAFERLVRWRIATELISMNDRAVAGQMVAENSEAGTDLLPDGDEMNALLGAAAFDLQHRILLHHMNNSGGQLDTLRASDRAMGLIPLALRGSRGDPAVLAKIINVAEAGTVLSVQSENRSKISESLAEMGWTIAALWGHPNYSNEAQKRVKAYLSNSRAWCERVLSSELGPEERESVRAIAVVRWILHDMLEEAAGNSTLLFAQNNREVIDQWQRGGKDQEIALTGDGVRDLAREPGNLAEWSREFHNRSPRTAHASLLAENMSLYAVRRAPEDANVQWQRAVVLDESNRSAEAMIPANAAFRLDPSKLSYINTLAVILARADEIGEAGAVYAQLKEKSEILPADDPDRILYEKNIRSFEDRWGEEIR
jgi:hypothetical protein